MLNHAGDFSLASGIALMFNGFLDHIGNRFFYYLLMTVKIKFISWVTVKTY